MAEGLLGEEEEEAVLGEVSLELVGDVTTMGEDAEAPVVVDVDAAPLGVCALWLGCSLPPRFDDKGPLFDFETGVDSGEDAKLTVSRFSTLLVEAAPVIAAAIPLKAAPPIIDDAADGLDVFCCNCCSNNCINNSCVLGGVADGG